MEIDSDTLRTNKIKQLASLDWNWNGALLNWQRLSYEPGHEHQKKALFGIKTKDDQQKVAFHNLKEMFNSALNDKNLNIRRYIDVGSNYGLTVPIMYNQCENIECFEIRSDVFECLEMNIANNNFSEKTRAHNIGLSNKKGFAWHNNNPVTGHTKVKKQYKLGRKRCSLVTLDSFNFQDVDLIKIDVEGHEHEVLKGSKKTIEYSRPICIVEAQAVRQKNMFNFFSSIDYNCHIILYNKLWGKNTKDFICVPNEKDYD